MLFVCHASTTSIVPLRECVVAVLLRSLLLILIRHLRSGVLTIPQGPKFLYLYASARSKGGLYQTLGETGVPVSYR